MAALTPGEPARMYALCKVARVGATRCGYVSGKVFVRYGPYEFGFGRSNPLVGIQLRSLTITDALDETPNTCAFRVEGWVPPRGMEIVITLGTKNSYTRQFAGHALTVQQGYGLKPANLYGDVHAVDYTWLLGAVKVTAQYTGVSATAIVADLVARCGGANGFTSAGVQAGLPVIDQITFTNEDCTAALTRTARRIGAYWYVDYHKVVHFFFSETRNGDPEPLTPAHASLAALRCERAGTQVLTRVYVEGRGSSLLAHVNIGDTMIPVETVAAFEAAADVFLKIAFQGAIGGAQHLNFTGVVPSAGGSLVGPGIAPPGAPTAAVALGAGLYGTYYWGYTFTTAAGETLISPAAVLNVGATFEPPAAAPTTQPLGTAGALTGGTHQWAVTFTTPDGGETTPSPVSAVLSSAIPVAPTGGIAHINDWGDGPFPSNTRYDYAVTYLGSAGGETIKAPYMRQFYTGSLAGSHWMELFIGRNMEQDVAFAAPPGITGIKVYRSRAGGGALYFVGTATVQPDGYGSLMGTFQDRVPDGSLGAPIPTTGTAQAYAGTVRVGMQFTAPAGVNGRKIYRTAAGTAQLRHIYTLNWNQALVAPAPINDYWDDALADSALGANVPTSNTAGTGIRAVQLANIAAGGAGVTGRKLYRTTGGGGQFKLLATIANNTATTYLDQLPDASLGAAPPASDTSGLTQPAGQVGAGATTIPVANPVVFEAGGGWAIIGNGDQVVRYTGKTGNAITGIPAAGIGSIVAAIVFNSTITTAPMLTGIPASGAGAIAGRALAAGDEVYSVVIVDDLAARAALAALVGGTGIREEWVQDRRLGVTEARSRAAATLAVRPLEEAALSYTSRDLRTAAGKVITVNLPPPTNLVGTFRIQTVTIANFRPHADQYPTYTVQASSARFSFEDWLRRLVVRE